MTRSVKIHNVSIHELIEAQVRLHPDMMAVISAEYTLTYTELNQRANQFAHYLQALGIEPEQRVALCLERSMDVLVVMVAILKAGACYVPLDPHQPKDRLSFILNDSHAVACITTATFAHSFQYEGHVVLYNAILDHLTYPTENLKKNVSNKQLAYVIYTSGTTGNPKGVLIEHQSVVNYGEWFTAYSNVTIGSRIDYSSNYMFDMAVTSTIIPLMSGLTVVICAEEIYRHYKRYLNYLNLNQIVIIKITPSYFKELLREIKNNFIALPSLHTIVLGGEQLSATDCSSWLEYYPHHTLINEYGPTEITVAFSHYRIDRETIFSADMNVPIGLPGNHMYYYILDENGQKVNDGDEGELYIGGMGLARGYLNLPELTQSRFVPDPFQKNARLYKTGDLCKQLPNGLLKYLGRIDRQVKIRGFRIELNEVEQCMEEHPDIQDAVVFVREHARCGKQLVAYYILNPRRRPLTYTQLREHLLKKLPHYMIPVSINNIDSFPLSANGKLDHSLFPTDSLKSNHATQKCTKLERIIMHVWLKELGLLSIGTDDNFWESGGHSFIAARIISQLNQLLEVEITYRQFHQAMTIKNLAKIIKKLTKQDSKNKTSQQQHHSTVMPLSDFQTLLWACKTFKPRAAKLNIISRKRLEGQFNRQALDFAFESVLQKHNILSYRISTLFPVQLIEKTKAVKVIEKDLQLMPHEEIEYILWDSMKELTRFSAWTARAALIHAKLFYLPNNMVELQICIPHMISDGLSIEILFNELSKYYLQYPCKLNCHKIHPAVEFSEYIRQEQILNESRVTQDLAFWSECMKDAHLYAFPKQYIVNPAKNEKFSYSTYVPIPSKALHHLEVFCMHQKASFSDVLSAVIGRSLSNCRESEKDNADHIVMNVVKSTRDSALHDETIGCFIQIEPVKLLLSPTETLKSLLEQLIAFTDKSAAFNRGSNILKLASLNPFYRKKKNMTYFLTKASIFLYQNALKMMKINHESLTLCPSLSLLDDKKRFMIYLNIWNNFVSLDQDKPDFFGLESRLVKMFQYDLLTVDYVFEVCFLRDENNNKPYVVISSNIEPAYREKIAHEMIRVMSDEMVTS